MSERPARDAEFSSADFPLTTRRVQYRPDLLVVSAQGEIDLLTAPRLARALDGDLPALVVVDLTRVTFLTAAGIGVLIEAAQRSGAAGHRLGVVAHDRLALYVLRMSAVAAEIPTYESLADAVRELASTHYRTPGGRPPARADEPTGTDHPR
ncbi:STAS domain-containing protein [Umezawaea beigongshangensis]|uniref:STAS domain-containing protein n=1 Tax=Umezawaea beigongshangensis TaxID=2780383 RepID=UPI0018F23D73|nr:STAS domain-containing protein [Umezawaea beigongshangensis]